MVHALREAHRVLTPAGVLIDVRPVIEPLVVEVVVATQTRSSMPLETYSAPDDVAAAGEAIRHAVSSGWFAFEASLPFTFEIYCDSTADLRAYAEARKLYGAAIPYAELDERLRESGADRLRCRRPWRLSSYRKT